MVGAPMIYYGDEVGLPGGTDPDCRRCMPWETQDWNNAVHDCYKQLASLRASQPALRRGEYESLLAIDRLFVFRRYLDSESIIVVLNAGNELVNITIDTHSHDTNWLNYFTGELVQADDCAIKFLHVPATSALVLIAQKPGRDS
jgi:glycosidase